MPHSRERVRNECSDLLVLVGDSDLLSEIATEWMFSPGIKELDKRIALYEEIKTTWPSLAVLLNKARDRGELFGDFQLTKKADR